MTERPGRAGPARIMVVVAAFIVIVAGMRAASDMIVPFLTAIFLAILCLPALVWMRERRIPDAIALTIVLSGLIVLTVATLYVVGTSLTGFQSKLPEYMANLDTLRGDFKAWLDDVFDLEAREEAPDAFDARIVLQYIGQALRQLSGLMSNVFIVLLMLAFILSELGVLEAKLRAVSADQSSAEARVDRIVADIKRYFSIKSLMSLCTGVAATVIVWFAGVDFPLIWGFAAFLLNYIPSIGSFLAAIPPVLLALVQPDLGPGTAVLVALGYVAINVVFGSVLEPRLMGQGLDLSTLVVFLSLVFWGWVFGPIGMLLSVPLTIAVKISLEAFPESRGIAVMLGSSAPRRQQ